MLLSGVQGITDLITTRADQPRLRRREVGHARRRLGADGHRLLARRDRAVAAAEMAISIPLLEASIDGATGVLLSIQGGSDLGLFEINEAAQLVPDSAAVDANIIFGAVIDDAVRRGAGDGDRHRLRPPSGPRRTPRSRSARPDRGPRISDRQRSRWRSPTTTSTSLPPSLAQPAIAARSAPRSLVCCCTLRSVAAWHERRVPLAPSGSGRHMCRPAAAHMCVPVRGRMRRHDGRRCRRARRVLCWSGGER